MKHLFGCIASVVAFGALPAAADEVWSTEIGDVVYERDLDNGMAVLSYPTTFDETTPRGFAYLNGMAGVYTGRLSFDGIWIETGEGQQCPVAISNPETGEPEYNWGRVELIFTKPDFPGGFVARRGYCFEEPSENLIGTPVTAE